MCCEIKNVYWNYVVWLTVGYVIHLRDEPVCTGRDIQYVMLFDLLSIIIVDGDKRHNKLRACWRLTETSAGPADAWITTAALYIIGVLFCCAACLEVLSALEESPILHRGPHARCVNTTTTLLVARARTQTCSRVHSICWRRHVSPSPALMLCSNRVHARFLQNYC